MVDPRCSRRAFAFAAGLGWLVHAARAGAAPACTGPGERLLLAAQGGRGLSVVDAATLQTLDRFDLAQPVCAGPRLTPDGRFAFYCTEGGGLFKYDLDKLALAAHVSAGDVARDLAISADGKWVLVGTTKPHGLLLFDAQLGLVRSYPATPLDGKASSAVASVHDAGPRRSFVVAFESMPELWEISYDPAAGPIFDGLVHDYRMGEALATPGYLGVRRTPLQDPIAVAGFDNSHRHVLATARSPGRAAATLDVVNLDVRRRIAQLPVRVAQSRDQTAAFTAREGQLIAVADAASVGTVRFVAPADWRIAHTLRIGGDALAMQTHPGARDVWVASGRREQDDVTLTLVDKQMLAPRAVVQLAGRWPAQIAFTCGGNHALVGTAGPRGTLAVHDARTGAEIKRIA